MISSDTCFCKFTKRNLISKYLECFEFLALSDAFYTHIHPLYTHTDIICKCAVLPNWLVINDAKSLILKKPINQIKTHYRRVEQERGACKRSELQLKFPTSGQIPYPSGTKSTVANTYAYQHALELAFREKIEPLGVALFRPYCTACSIIRMRIYGCGSYFCIKVTPCNLKT